MKFKIFCSFVALVFMFSACNNDEPNGNEYAELKSAAADCLTSAAITSSDYDKAGTEYKGSALVKIAEGITLEKVKANDHELKFSADVARGTITLSVKNGNIFTKYTFDTECMKGKMYVFSGKDVSGIRYGQFVATPIFTVTFVTLDGEVIGTASCLYILDPNNWGGEIHTNFNRLKWADVRRDIPGADDWNEATFNVPAGLQSIPNKFLILDGTYLDGYGGEVDVFEFMVGTIKSNLIVTVLTEEIPCFEPADLSGILSAIAEARAIRGSYTPGSWAALQSAITALEDKIASKEWTICDDLDAEFGDLLTDLETAKDGLWRNDCGLGLGQWFPGKNASNTIPWPGSIWMGGYEYTEAEGQAIYNVNGTPAATRIFRAYAKYLLNVSAEYVLPAEGASLLADIDLVEAWLAGVGQKLSPSFLPDPKGNSAEANAAKAAENAADRISEWSKCFNKDGN